MQNYKYVLYCTNKTYTRIENLVQKYIYDKIEWRRRRYWYLMQSSFVCLYQLVTQAHYAATIFKKDESIFQ